MRKSELRTAMRNLLLKKFDNVEEFMYHPAEYAELSGSFPYITMVFNQWTPQNTALYGTQSIEIIGIASGDKDTLMDKVDQIENDIIDAIYKQDPKANITLVDNNNLFAPFGINAGVYFPYAGCRISCTVANVKS
ncbi:MAG: hypothetical protein GY861_13985 [bacterium]|nr:hypothetical protein [bacterium]